MKNITKILALVLVLSMVCIVFASCGKTLSGTYKAELGSTSLVGGETVYTFSGKKVTISVTAGALGFEKTTEFEGTYEITEEDDGDMKITFTFEDKDAEKYNQTATFEETEDGIKIGLIEYKKQ